MEKVKFRTLKNEQDKNTMYDHYTTKNSPNNCHRIKDNRLEFCDDFNGKIQDIVFPNNLHTIYFGNRFNQKIDDVKFPNNLRVINFGTDFNQCIDKVHFPDNLHSIIFDTKFNQQLDNVQFPVNLHTIKFGWDFNQKLDKVVFPSGLHTIKFGHDFNQPVFFLLGVHIFDFSESNIANFVNKELPLTLKEVVVDWKSKGTLNRLPYGCIETIV